jgi:Methyltransferase domain
MPDFESRLAALDLSLFDAIESQTSPGDRASLLAVQAGLRARGSYAYLEIGSHLGGSIQPYLLDPRCVAIYSIDPRPVAQQDARGRSYAYAENSSRRMVSALSALAADRIDRLRCFEADARFVDVEALDPPPALCFVDGEHTDAAVVSDFDVCRRALRGVGAILFHDAHVVYNGLWEITRALDVGRVPFRAYNLPDSLFVVELGTAALWKTPAVAGRLARAHEGYLASLRLNDHYRRFATRWPVPWLRRLRARIPVGRSRARHPGT